MAEIQHKIPPVRLYEVRTAHGEAYRAGGDVIEQGDGWFTLWADHHSGELSLRVPEADIRAVWQTDLAELEAEAEASDRRELKESEAARAKLRHLGELLAEARQWARHGYEIGQRHCSWTDHGVAPDWLTEGWPRSFESCEHVQQAAAFDEALTRVRNLSTSPEIMNAQQEHPGVWEHGYECGVRAAKSAARIRTEEASGS
ncbi:hypothetical protein OG864_45525 [Streptomyces sp. NBC_00124]|uniref:hypothetical protein n=1 Tax=Streptomyces sp. NBC_00124 TaxID=2975662 RepID=UPI00224EA210|nr:hypothetical protein [Streptomyces sp. NBC_00124]MCX5365965.1 hypothetical protein [Streptomyces sp. NBC_00124]